MSLYGDRNPIDEKDEKEKFRIITIDPGCTRNYVIPLKSVKSCATIEVYYSSGTTMFNDRNVITKTFNSSKIIIDNYQIKTNGETDFKFIENCIASAIDINPQKKWYFF